MEAERLIRWFETLSTGDVAMVGGKNASLGEMLRHLTRAGIRVPEGFASTVTAYWEFVDANDLRKPIDDTLKRLQQKRMSLAEAGETLRDLFLQSRFPPAFEQAIRDAYRELSRRTGLEAPPVAVRSSATAEDLPEASFAGQQDSFLNVRGEDALLDACRRCYASLFTDRALSYREYHGFDHLKVALSVGIQRMVRSDLAGAGVMFSIDPETGFRDVVMIDANWGLGESVVQGAVEPDAYGVFKPLLDSDYRPVIDKRLGAKEEKVVYAPDGATETVACEGEERSHFVLDDDEILQLAKWAAAIERHYGRPMDIEWAKDGETDELYIVQARPETVQSAKQPDQLKTYRLTEQGEPLAQGLGVGSAIAAGPVCKLGSAAEIDRFPPGGVLVAHRTDPDWVPVMKQAAAIVTDEGGRTSHAAIVSRELGLPAVVGAGNATQSLEEGAKVTVSCAEGDQGFVYAGRLAFEAEAVSLGEIPHTHTQIMFNLANPATALGWARLPADGVGLARMEFIIGNLVRIHPMALVRWPRLEDDAARDHIARLTPPWLVKTDYFVDTLAYGIARIAASQYPRPVILRFSDFKTNEYAHLIGGAEFEPHEENPMLGWRGASRYYHPDYREGFALECQAIAKVRDEIGMTNLKVMIPFCRSPEEADRVLAVMAEEGLRRGERGLEVYLMCELPSNIERADEFARRVDGFSIGSNDLTQLALGVDRDSNRLAELFNEEDPTVTRMIERLLDVAHRYRLKVGLCGQAPSTKPGFARFLVAAGIDSISVDPASFLSVKQEVAASERARPRRRVQ